MADAIAWFHSSSSSLGTSSSVGRPEVRTGTTSSAMTAQVRSVTATGLARHRDP
jgi:hypothetical protein